MKRIAIIIFYVLSGASSLLYGTPAVNCSSFVKDGNTVTFHASDSSALRLQLCSQSVVKVWFSPDGGFQRNNPSFAVINENLEDIGELNVDEQPSCYEIFTPYLRIRIDKEPLGLQIFDKYQKLLFGDYAGKGRASEGEWKAEYKVLRRDEHFFGLGEKAGRLDRRGQSYKMWNSDKPCYGVEEDPLYKSIPFFMSNYRYGIFLDNTYKTGFKFGTESSEYYSFETTGGEMVYYFIFGKDYKEIISKYVALTGKPVMPPDWAFGFAQSRGLLTNESLTYEIAEGYRSRSIPCDIIYQDIGWTQYLQDFEFRKDNYKNPEKMLSDLKSMGFKVVVSQDPVISQANVRQWREADSLGYFVKDSATGKSYDMPWPWGGNCGVVDFTLPDVADWWGSYQQKPLDLGVSGFWTDMGEPAWSNEEQVERLSMKHHAGMHDEIHNVYGLTWDKVVKEQFEKRNPDRRVFQMTRSAFAGMQRYTFGWTGDSGNCDGFELGWAQMENQIPVLLSAGLGIIPFVTCDISGYCGDISDYGKAAELYVRWVQLGAFNPLSRIHHEGNTAVEPWLFGEEAERIVKEAIELKYTLFPYIYTFAREAHETGLPIMRPMFLEYPMDQETFGTDGQFMFGSEMLVAPVLRKNARNKNVYLPEGQWINYNDKITEYDGEQWITVEAPLSLIPVFVKKGSIIPKMPVMNYIGENPAYPVTFEVFPAATGLSAEFTLYEDDGEDLGYLRGEYLRTPVSCVSSEDRLVLEIGEREGKFTVPENRTFIFRIFAARMPKKAMIDGAGVKKGKKDAVMTWNVDKESGSYGIILPDDGKSHKIEFIY